MNNCKTPEFRSVAFPMLRFIVPTACAAWLAIASNPTYAKDDIISIRIEEVSLQDTLKALSEMSKGGPFVLHESVPSDIRVNTDVDDMHWRDLLLSILEEESLYLIPPAKEGLPYTITAVNPNNGSNDTGISQNEIDDKVASLVPQLGAKDFKTRKAADDQLRDLPDEALKAIQAHFRSAKDPEVRMRLKEILDIGLVPGITAEELKRMKIPALEFRQANIHDCLDFLKSSANKKFQIRTRIAGQAPPITFKASQISVYEALDIITQVSNLTFTIIDGVVVVHNRSMPE